MLGGDRLAARFPTIDRVTRERGFDWSREPIPVTPAAHYLMGGIATDLDGRTSLAGLIAVGETARTGVHGANRLASNSLLEGAVFGARAAEALDSPWLPYEFASPQGVLIDTDSYRNASGITRAALQHLMWEHAGLLRTEEGLAHTLGVVSAWRAAASAPVTVAEHEDANLLLLASAVASAALARTVSVGAHYIETSELERV
jgi:L-aspartate oxidase